jgi:hypothetical protein
LPRECHEGGALRLGRLLVHDQHGRRRIRVAVGIAQGRFRLDGCNDAQSLETDTVPAASRYAPAEDGLVADETDLAVGEARAGVDVGAAGLDVVPSDLLGGGDYGRPASNLRWS